MDDEQASQRALHPEVRRVVELAAQTSAQPVVYFLKELLEQIHLCVARRRSNWCIPGNFFVLSRLGQAWVSSMYRFLSFQASFSAELLARSLSE